MCEKRAKNSNYKREVNETDSWACTLWATRIIFQLASASLLAITSSVVSQKNIFLNSLKNTTLRPVLPFKDISSFPSFTSPIHKDQGATQMSWLLCLERTISTYRDKQTSSRKCVCFQTVLFWCGQGSSNTFVCLWFWFLCQVVDLTTECDLQSTPLDSNWFCHLTQDFQVCNFEICRSFCLAATEEGSELLPRFLGTVHTRCGGTPKCCMQKMEPIVVACWSVHTALLARSKDLRENFPCKRASVSWA